MLSFYVRTYHHSGDVVIREKDLTHFSASTREYYEFTITVKTSMG